MAITLVQKNKSRGIMTWYARVPDPHRKGVVHYYSLGTSTKSDARRAMQNRIRSGSFDIEDPKESLTLGEAVAKFEKYERSKGAKPNSIASLLNSAKVLEPLFSRPLSSITKAEIAEQFLRKSETVKASTYRTAKGGVIAMFNYFVNILEAIPVNIAKSGIPRRKVQKAIRHFWTGEQIDMLLATVKSPRVRLLWAFMAFAGLRRSEAESMRPEKIRDGYIHIVGKGDKEATIPVSPRLQREIDRYKGDWNFRFDHKLLAAVAAKAIPEGFPGTAHAHRFRHSFGSNLIRGGANIKVVQRLMRHETIAMTLDIYGHILDDDAKEAIDKIFR